jgi:hypothetical protein
MRSVPTSALSRFRTLNWPAAIIPTATTELGERSANHRLNKAARLVMGLDPQKTSRLHNLIIRTSAKFKVTGAKRHCRTCPLATKKRLVQAKGIAENPTHAKSHVRPPLGPPR